MSGRLRNSMRRVGFPHNMFDKRLLKNIDLPLIGAVILLSAFGCAMIYSACAGNPKLSGLMERQIVWVVVGLMVMTGVMLLDYHVIERFSRWIYWINVVCLLLVLKLGHSSGGSQRWLGMGTVRFQPSEFAKVAIIMTLAVCLSRRHEKVGKFSIIVESLLQIAVPMGLIFVQPDLGTSLALVAIWYGMLWVAGANGWYLAAIALATLGLGAVGWVTGIIKDYQKARIAVVINPDFDKLRTGYQITQSQIAIGSGGLWGKGYTHGTQNRLDFIPAQATDFINTVIGEELGFVGSVTLLALFLFVIYRCFIIAASTENFLGSLLAAGVGSLIAFHAVVNIGMTIRLMPVTGLPLIFLSYGGSSVIMGYLAIGLVESVSMRRHRLAF